MGLSYHLPVRYGTASVMVALCVIGLDLLMHEPIGMGTLFDAVGVGKAVDLLRWLDLLPPPQGLWHSLIYLLLGMLLVSVGQWIYMAAGVGCGPRDSLLVGLGKRFRRVPIGVVTVALYALVLLGAWMLSGPIGIGTLLYVALQGPIMQAVFTMAHFEARGITHDDLLTTLTQLKGT